MRINNQNTMEKAKISVIIPVFNGEKYLSEAIESVIDQGNNNMEIIIVDDASTDNSMRVAASFGSAVSIHKHSINRGAGAARTLGIDKSNGEFLSFLDADDFWDKEKQTNQLNYLETNPNIDMVFGMVEQFVSAELSIENQNRLRSELTKMPGFAAGAMLVRKETFLKVGWFDEKLELGEFIDWFSRAKDMGITHHMFDDIVLKRRIHTTNMGIKKHEHLKDYTAILRAALARKRMNKKQ